MFVIEPRGEKYPHFPALLLDGTISSLDLEALVERNARHADNRDMWDPDQPEIGPYFLPPFQRPPVWTLAQKTRFVESALLGITMGSIVVCDAMNLPMQSPHRFARTDRWLVDGQQRLMALLDYRNDLITPFAGTACEHRWSDLTVVERRRFWSLQIGIIRIATADEALLREIYDRLNFGGTAHTDEQRAVAG